MKLTLSGVKLDEIIRKKQINYLWNINSESKIIKNILNLLYLNLNSKI